jgi:hypothetical protein
MLRLKRGDVIAEPHRGESGRARYAQRSLDGFAVAALARIGEQRQGPLHVLRVAPAARRERDSLAAAARHLEAENRFEHREPVTDRTAGDAEILRGLPYGPEARKRFERLQCMHRGDARFHGVQKIHLKIENFARPPSSASIILTWLDHSHSERRAPPLSNKQGISDA